MQQFTWKTFSMVFAPLAASFLIYASDQSNFSGVWKLAPARSPGVNDAVITLIIKDEGARSAANAP